MEEKSILLMGLPSSGKSTFIAAFWYFLNNSAKEQLLKVDTLADSEHEYLNSISQNWLSYTPVSRTRNSNGENIKIRLKHSKNNQSIALDIPDFSGETFKSHFDNREWTKDYHTLLNTINGIILFINPNDENNTPTLISDANESARVLGDTLPLSNEGIKFNSYIPEYSCSQVRLVEELQFINHHKPNIIPLKVAIIISAWDEIEKIDKNYAPEKWIEKHTPLLYQYLICNSNIYSQEIFGVSAQGLNYEESDMEAIYKRVRLDHIIVKYKNEVSNDISKPIVWITE